MITKKNKLILSAVAVVVILLIYMLFIRDDGGQKYREIKPVVGDINIFVSTVGTVKPQNRLEIKPPISGRVERILVEEGREIKSGEVLAYISSIERATLIDAARLEGKQEFDYWQRAYKETPIISPIDGIVIVRNVEPGQTVNTSDAMLVLSNRLIVEADVDETDIGGVKVGDSAIIGLDAYPEIKVASKVDHISYESQIINNVTIYKVDILTESIPEVFRSGMSASVEILVRQIKDAILIPVVAVIRTGDGSFVMVKDENSGKLKRVKAITGAEKDGDVEIISGISKDDTVVVPEMDYSRKKQNGTNPFLPDFKGKDKGKR